MSVIEPPQSALLIGDERRWPFLYCVCQRSREERRSGRKCRSDFRLRQFGLGAQNENGSAKYGAIRDRRESVRFEKRKRGFQRTLRATALKADARDVAVADVRFGPRHQQTVEPGEQAAEQGIGGGKGDGSGLGHIHSLVLPSGDGRLIPSRAI